MKELTPREKYIKDELEKLLNGCNLTTKQKLAIDTFIDLCKSNFENKKRFVISGKGGVGKSYILTLMVQIADIFSFQWNACCYTGKGTNVLRERGVRNASTIHSMMYIPRVNIKGQLIGFIKKEELSYSLMFVDEFSMLDEDLINDLENYGIPIVYFGDSFQLPPVGKDCSYLEPYVDIELDEVVRQAEGSPIVKWSNYIRDKNKVPYNICDVNEVGKFIVLSQKYDGELINKLKLTVDQMIVGTNKLRDSLNKEYRVKNNKNGLLSIGEKLIVLKNNKSFGFYNGQDIIVKEILGEEFKDDMGVRCIKIITDENYEINISTECIHDYTLNPNKLFNKRKPKDYEEPIFVDYGYAKSCYKMQGSQCDSTLVFSSSMWWMNMARDGKTEEKAWEHFCRGIYTSTSRSVKECYFILP